MIIGIIQARMGSSRFPGKVMESVCGKPLIGHMLDRLKMSRLLEKVIIATSTDMKNDSLCEYLQKRGTDVFRGDEDDVLDRFYKAAITYHPSSVMRLTGDCPLIDPVICDHLIQSFLEKKVDYACLTPAFAEGLDCEIMTMETLKKIYQKAQMKSEREHVTLYLHNHKNDFAVFKLDNYRDDSLYRIVVDEPEDFIVVKKIMEYFYEQNKELFTFEKIKEFLDRESELKKVNAHIIRNDGLLKSLAVDKKVKG